MRLYSVHIVESDSWFSLGVFKANSPKKVILETMKCEDCQHLLLSKTIPTTPIISFLSNQNIKNGCQMINHKTFNLNEQNCLEDVTEFIYELKPLFMVTPLQSWIKVVTGLL